ncbi:MAG: sodium:calcium antiporter [Chloroflexia bacterium]
MGVGFSWAMLVVGLIVILIGCDIFTNSIEWLGKKLSLNEGLLGSIFAAVGTALPETLIPIVAVLTAASEPESAAHAQDVGLGAIIGAPFMLATVAMLVTGTAIFIYTRSGRRKLSLNVNAKIISRDIRFFIIAFAVALGASFIDNSTVKLVIAISLLGYYAFYVYKHATDKGHADQEDAEDISPLHFRRHSPDPPLVFVILQTIVGVALIVGAAYLFVQYVSDAAASLGVSSLVLSLIIVPLATELPEKFNSVLWVRRGKDTLAMGNITGAMVFQSTLPVAFGLVFTEWRMSPEYVPAFLQAALAVVASLILFAAISRRGRLTARSLLMSGIWYIVWLVLVFPLEPQIAELVRKLGWGV